MACRTRTTRLLVTLFAAASVFGGCSSTSSDAEERILDQTVSIEIFNYLMAELMFIGYQFDKSLPVEAENNAVPELFQIVFDEYSTTVNCSEGGSMSQTGSVSSDLSEEGTGSIETNITQTISDCVITTSQGLFVVNGKPNLKSWGSMDVVSWQPTTFLFTFEGGYTWEGAGITGDCSMEISYSVNLQDPSSLSMSGHMCGYTY